jgi:hypothetical protein
MLGEINPFGEAWKGAIFEWDESSQDWMRAWECDHLHFRRIRNITASGGEVWEYSARHCAEIAMMQLDPTVAQKEPEGKIGNVGRPLQTLNSPTNQNVHFVLRQDVKEVRSNGHTYYGHIRLNDIGHRELLVYYQPNRENNNVSDWLERTGSVLIDKPKRQRGRPAYQDPTMEDLWLTMVGRLHSDIKGVVFRNPHVFIEVNTPDIELTDYYLPKRKQHGESQGGMFVRTLRDEGKRYFAIVDKDNNVLDIKTHRGQAKRRLDELSTK